MQQIKLKQEEPIDLFKLFYQNKKINQKITLKNNLNLKPQTYSLEEFTESLSSKQLNHLLNRVLVGTSKRHFDDVLGFDFKKIIEKIFTPESKFVEPKYDWYYEINKDEMENQWGAKPFVDPGQVWINSVEPNHQPYEKTRSLNCWIYKCILNQDTSIHWKIVYFLHTLVPTNIAVNSYGQKASYYYWKLLFDNAFGSYKDLMLKMSLEPQMMVYLDVWRSHKDSPNENYARELLELYTVGKGPGSGFLESDIYQIARIFTGFRLTRMGEGPHQVVYEDFAHDTGDKKLSSFFNNHTIKGRLGQNYSEEVEDLIDIIFSIDEPSKFLARRIYQFFVNPVISSEIELNIINKLSEDLRANNYNLGKTIKRLISSKHFFDSVFFNSIIKPPLEYLSSIYKELLFDNYFEYVSDHDWESQPNKIKDLETRDFYILDSFRHYLYMTGFEINNPPSVSGWIPYYQAPEFDKFWINTYTVTQRQQFANRIGGKGESNAGIHVYYFDGSTSLRIDYTKYLKSFSDPSNIDSLIDECLKRFILSDVDDITRNRLKNSITNGNSDEHWTEYYNQNKNNYWSLNQRLEHLFHQIFQLIEINIF